MSPIRWCREEIRSLLRRQERGAGRRGRLPEYIEQAINVELRRGDIQTRLYGKDVLPQAGEYTRTCCCDGLAPS